MALSNAPDIAPERTRQQWEVEYRPESGNYVCTEAGQLLFRVSRGMFHFWDRRRHQEISISVEQIVELAD